MTICGVLNEYLSNEILPNSVELLGIYGRVCLFHTQLMGLLVNLVFGFFRCASTVSTF